MSDKRRFSTIDHQINRVIEIIGDGRISGWQIVQQDFPNVLIVQGEGIINGFYVNTFNDQIFELSANGTFYFFAQRRVGLIGTVGPKSDIGSVIYEDDGPPVAVVNFMSIILGPFSVELSWSANTEIDFDHYRLERSTNGEDFVLVSETTSISFSDVAEEDSIHEYLIYAIDQSGNRSIPESTIATTPLDVALPPDPIPVSMPASEAGINVLWHRPIQISFSKIQHWKITVVQLNPNGSPIAGTQLAIISNKNNYNERIDDLIDGQKYKVTIQTVDTKNRESPGISHIVVPQPTPAPRDPQGIAFSETDLGSSVSVLLSWTDGDIPYDPISSYRFKIYVTVDGQAESIGIDVPIGETEEEVSLYTFDLLNFFSIPYQTLITFRITAVSIDGIESFGNYIRFVTSNFVTPFPVVNLTASFDFDDKQLVADWQILPGHALIHIKLEDDDLNIEEQPESTIDEYGVITVGELDLVVFDDFIGKATHFVFPGDLDHRYTLTVTPYDIEGNQGVPTVIVVISTFAGGLPLPDLPTGVLTKAGDREILIEWKPSLANYTSHHKIYRKEGFVGFNSKDWILVETIPKTTNSFTDYGRTNGQTYSYYITAFDVYSRESLHLPDGAINLNFVEESSKSQGILTAPEILSVELSGNEITLSWDTLLEEFDAFTIYKSVDNLYSFESLATVDKNTFSYVDSDIPLIDGTVFYYLVDKSINDADIVVQTTNIPPENAVLIGSIQLLAASFGAIDITDVRDIKDLEDPIAEYTNRFLLPHKHREIEPFDPDRIDLNAELIITDWTTVDGRIFFTSEINLQGSSAILKVDGQFPSVFFNIDLVNRRIVFAESIVELDDDGNIIGDIPSIELRILGLEEVQGVLDAFRFDEIHARQVQFGTLNKEQLPEIGHEGRIRERLLPKRFLLERFSNHNFIVPQQSNDTTKNFGDGTAFFAFLESDGQIEDVIDFDDQETGALVGFRKPSFSPTTFLNLKQTLLSKQVSDAFDDAVQNDDGTHGGWVPNSDTLAIGKSEDGIVNDIFIRFKISVPVGATITSAKLIFTSRSEQSSTKCKSKISVIDPAEFNETVNLALPFPSNLETFGPINWEIPAWELDEVSDNTTSPDITTLLQSYVESSFYFSGIHAVIKIVNDASDAGALREAYSYDGNANLAPILELTYTIDSAEVDIEVGGFQSEKSYHFNFEFEDTKPTRWVRVTTFDSPISPNPVIKIRKRLRFRILMTKGSIYLTLGIREIDLETPPAVGSNGGITGPVEWVAINDTVTDDDGNIAPRGILIEANDEWQEFDIDLKKANVLDFENGNGILSNEFGVLEHLAFTINPDSTDPTGPFDIYIDEIQQVDDVIVAGTSQGILISNDFGTTWKLSRLTDTPVHKFYKAKNNKFIWAISATEALIAIDPAFWFATTGTAGVQYVRDIVEDQDGNMFISTEKGVYWFEIALINTFASWRQTKPITPFTSDMYGMYANDLSSALTEILVSTEVGIFKTIDMGETWIDTGMTTGGLVAYEFLNISTNINIPNIIAINRKHVLRKFGNETDFTIIANFEDQHNIFDIWTMAHFDDRLYVSSGNGVYVNTLDELFGIEPNIPFEKTFHGLDDNNFIKPAFALDVISLGIVEEVEQLRLFIGQENVLKIADKEHNLSTRKQFSGKSLPTFFKGDEELIVGFIYNAFNNVLVFREPQPVNVLYYAAHIPRKTYFPLNGGWSHTNPDAEIFIYVNGFPVWLDFVLDEVEILSRLQIFQGKLKNAGKLSTFNSNFPLSETTLSAMIADLDKIFTGNETEGQEGQPLITDQTIIKFVDDFTRFVSLVTKGYASANEITTQKILLKGLRRADRATGTRGEILEQKENFEADDSVGIQIDIVTGEVSFVLAFAGATSLEDKSKFTFDKFDHLAISIFNSNVRNTGEFTHRELENSMESINTGLCSDLAGIAYGDMIKLGIFFEQQNNFMFDRFNISNIQSRYYAAHTNDWYDMLNSTIDFQTLIDVPTVPHGRFTTAGSFFVEDPYFPDRLWIGTDKDIIQYEFIDKSLVLEKILRPGDGLQPLYIWDIFTVTESEIYVIGAEPETNKSRLFLTTNFGTTWIEQDTINLPVEFYTFKIINGNKVVTSSEGVFYNDNNFGTWLPAGVFPSSTNKKDSPSLLAFKGKKNVTEKNPNGDPIVVPNIELTTFMIIESDGWFFRSGQGLEFVSLSNQILFVINKVIRFKNLTWIGTDIGIYNDGNTIIGSDISFSLVTTLEETPVLSGKVAINDIAIGEEALYAGGSNGKIYRFFNTEADDLWAQYTVPDFGTIHNMVLHESFEGDFLFVSSYNQIKVIDVTEETGVFG